MDDKKLDVNIQSNLKRKDLIKMEIYKVKDYKVFANELRERTGCNVIIKLMSGKDHVHYQLNKMGLSLGVLCVDRGEMSFAPFERLETAKNEQFINAQYLPLFDDFVNLLTVFREMFVE